MVVRDIDKYEFKPLDFDEEAGVWSWPPEYVAEGSHLFPTSVRHMEDVLWTLVHEGGEVRDDKSGLAMTILADKLHTWLKPNSQLRKAVMMLRTIGFVEVEKASAVAKRTRAVRLMIPPEQVPGTDPHPKKKESARDRAESILDDLDAVAERERLKRIADAAEANGADTDLETINGDVEPDVEPLDLPPFPTDQLGFQRLAVAMMDEFVRRLDEKVPASWADRNHIKEKLDRAENRLKVVERELLDEKALTNRMRTEKGVLDRKIELLEGNLATAIAAAREMAQKAGISVSEDTQKAISRMMAERPGIVRGGN